MNNATLIFSIGFLAKIVRRKKNKNTSHFNLNVGIGPGWKNWSTSNKVVSLVLHSHRRDQLLGAPTFEVGGRYKMGFTDEIQETSSPILLENIQDAVPER